MEPDDRTRAGKLDSTHVLQRRECGEWRRGRASARSVAGAISDEARREGSRELGS